MKRILKDYCTFSATERGAAVVMLLLIGVFIALPYCFNATKAPLPITDTVLETTLNNLSRQQLENATGQEAYGQQFRSLQPVPSSYELFAFNPNTLDAAGWKRLGLPEKTIRTLLNYRSKGGRFKSAEDIRKIWGLSPQIANRIIPYAEVESPKEQKLVFGKATWNVPEKPKMGMVDVNTATPQQLQFDKSINLGICYRIVKFRDKLGGFVSMNQVKETYGLTDSLFQFMLPHLQLANAAVKKININTASELDLSAHPYINRYVAKAIVLYRTNNGNFKSINELKNIAALTEAVFAKIQPYITVEVEAN